MALLVDYLQLDKFSPDPVSPEDGDVWYNEATDTIKIRAESITRSLVDEFLFATHSGSLLNPHEVTKTQVGLGSVTNDAQLKRSNNDFSLFTEKGTPVDADILLIEDSTDSGTKKKIQIGNLPGGSGGDDVKVKVSSGDTTSDFLSNKITAGFGISTTILNPSGDEELEISYATISGVNTVYVGKHGNDSNGGMSNDDALLTFGAAITLATSLGPTINAPVVINCLDAGKYQENLLQPSSHVHIRASAATLYDTSGNTMVSLDADTSAVFHEVFKETGGGGGTTIALTSTPGKAYFKANIVRCNNTCTAFQLGNTNPPDSRLLIEVEQIFVENGTGLQCVFEPGSEMQARIGAIEISGTGVGIQTYVFAGTLDARVGHIVDAGAGTAIDNNAGTININIQHIDCNVAYNVIASTTLNMFVNDISGTTSVAGTANVTIAGVPISAPQHKILRHLIHFIDDGPGGDFASGAYKEILPAANPFPTSEIWYESAAKTQKIVEVTTTRNANKTPSTEEWKMYDEDGSTVLVTVTDTISYSGIFETSRTRTIV